MQPLFWTFLAFSLAPLLGVGIGSSDPKVAVEVFAQRIFPIIVLLLVLATRRFDRADLFARAFPLYLCAVSVPVLLGLLASTGDSLEAVAGIAVNAYVSVFQNLHSAALAHAIAAISAFALLVRFPGRFSLPLLAVVFICVVLTTITTARSGLVAVVVGIFAIAWLTRNLKFFVIVAALAAFLGILGAMIQPELVDLAFNRLMGRNLYVVDFSADAMTSGRLTLQQAALHAYADQPFINQLFGMGRSASMEAIGRYSGHYLIAHNAFVDELISNGAFGLVALVASLAAGTRLTWRNARRGYPAGFALMLALLIYAVLQGIDYSLHLSIVGIVILLETRARLQSEAT
jgi:O-antigen ligase